MRIIFSITMLLFVFLTSCKKTEPVAPIPSTETIKVSLHAVISVGTIVYDSLPAQWSITYWDANNIAHQKDTLLGPGVNLVDLPKGHLRYQFSVNKWGVTSTMTLSKREIQEGVVYTLGGNKQPKKLRAEEISKFVTDQYQPSSKIVYSYNTKGLSVVDYYQKFSQFPDLQLTGKHVYNYDGANVNKIDVFDGDNAQTGFISFNYNAQGTKITNIHQKSHDIETFAAVDHSFPTGGAEININYTFSNGKSMEYNMKIRGGNIAEDLAISPTSGRESGTYRYDYSINPYAHMNMPNVFLSNISRNNLTDQNKTYVGSYPTADLFKLDYTYDGEGYPTEVIKQYRDPKSGELVLKTKTVFLY